jgi:16S rRNA (guanine527-N7)-methyltransferase
VAENELRPGLQALGLNLSEEQIKSLLTYCELVEKWNRHFNLLSASDLPRMISRHVLDSLAIAKDLEGSQRILDVGTGAGLPGIPLAIALPDQRFVLLDSNSKKTRFLFQVRLALELHNVDIVNSRVELYQSPEQIDIVICRAFASLSMILRLTRHCFTAETLLLALKGRFPEQEIADLPAGFEIAYKRRLSIPGNDSERHVIAVRIETDSQAK